MRGRGNELRRRRGSETRKRHNGGVYETDPPQEDGHPFVLKLNQQASTIRMIRTRLKMGFPVVSVRYRDKRMGNYCTNSGIYTVDYEIKGDRRKMLGKTIKVENVP